MKKSIKIFAFLFLAILTVFCVTQALPKTEAAIESAEITFSSDEENELGNYFPDSEITGTEETAEGESGVTFQYNINNGEIYITEILYCENKDVVIPEELNGYPVVALTDHCWSSMKSVYIPKTVREISLRFFSFIEEIESITVDEGNGYFSSDSDGVLYNKDKTRLIRYPQGKAEPYSYTVAQSVTEIGAYAFENTKLTDITVPGNVKFINSYAFANGNIGKATLKEGVETIGSAAFGGCDYLADVTLPGSIEFIDLYPFTSSGIVSNKENFDEDGVLYIGDYLVASLSNSSSKSYTVKDGTRIIAGGTLRWAALEEIHIPASVESVGPLAMIRDGKPLKVNVSDESEYLCTDEFGVLYTKDMKTLIGFTVAEHQTCYVVPDGVENIAALSLRYNSVIQYVYIPKSVTFIGCGTFNGTGTRHKIIYYEGNAADFEKINLRCGIHHHRYDDTNRNHTVIYNSHNTVEHEVIQVNEYEYSCTVAGGEEYICSCGYTYLDAKGGEGHKVEDYDFLWVNYSYPSCETDGVKVKYCEKCGEIGDSYVYKEKYGHDYVAKFTYSATCDRDGYIDYYCKRCQNEYTEVIKATGHTDSEKTYTQPPTCTEDGALYRICGKCSKKYEAIRVFTATGHRKSTWITDIEPNCGSQGKQYLKCDACSYTLDYRILPSLGHSYKAEILSQDCTQKKTKYTCERCNGSYYSTVKQNHAAGEWVYESDNIYSLSCTLCKTEIERKEVSLTLNRADLSIEAGKTNNITATVTDNISSEIVFTTSDRDIATVSENGTVTAKSIGTSVITATVRDTDITATCSVTVEAPKIPSIHIKNNFSREATVNRGESIKLSVKVSNRPEGAKVVWYINGKEASTGNTIVVSPESTSLVTVVLKDKNGKVLRDANNNQVSDTIKINVENSFYARIIGFFRNLFGIRKTVTF